jgi:hypothetical protein
MTKESLEMMISRAEIALDMIEQQNYGLAKLDIKTLIQNMEYHLEDYQEEE